MRLFDQRIEVELEEGSRHRPRLLHTPIGTLSVRQRLDFWVVQTNWWGKEVHRIYLLLDTSGGMVEVFVDHSEDWWLHRVQD